MVYISSVYKTKLGGVGWKLIHLLPLCAHICCQISDSFITSLWQSLHNFLSGVSLCHYLVFVHFCKHYPVMYGSGVHMHVYNVHVCVCVLTVTFPSPFPFFPSYPSISLRMPLQLYSRTVTILHWAEIRTLRISSEDVSYRCTVCTRPVRSSSVHMCTFMALHVVEPQSWYLQVLYNVHVHVVDSVVTCTHTVCYNEHSESHWAPLRCSCGITG